MNPRFYKKLESYAQSAINLTKRYFDLNDLEFDHICYQTVSKRDYLKARKQLQADVEIIGEIPHAGRMLTLAKLKKPVVVNGVTVDRLELAEPKPKRAVKSRAFDHFSFTVKGDFDKAIKDLKKQEAKISEVKQIGDHKFFKCRDEQGRFEIEFRNKKLEEALGVRKKKDAPTSLAEERKEGKRTPVQSKKQLKEDKGDGRISKLEDKLRIEKERRLRALADYQNLQKRLEGERDKITTVANSILLGQLLDILDDFDRALENLKIEERDQVGLRLVRDKLRQTIDASGLEEIKCDVGDRLDPHTCEAVGVVAIEKDGEDNTIKQIVQKGYRMKKSAQVVRPVKVIVGKKGE